MESSNRRNSTASPRMLDNNSSTSFRIAVTLLLLVMVLVVVVVVGVLGVNVVGVNVVGVVVDDDNKNDAFKFFTLTNDDDDMVTGGMIGYASIDRFNETRIKTTDGRAFICSSGIMITSF